MTLNRITVRGTIISVTFVLAYVAGWLIVANFLKSEIAEWVIDRRTGGWTIEHGTITMEGFPFSWHASIGTPHLSQTEWGQSYSWTGPAIALNWHPWNPRTVYYSTAGAHKFRVDSIANIAGPETTLELTGGEGHLVFGPRGRLHQLAILLDDARLSLPEASSLRFNRFRALIDNNPRGDGVKPGKLHLTPSLRLDGDIVGLTLPEGQRAVLGRTIGRISLGGTIMGRIPPGRPLDALSAWQMDGGTVEISHLNVGWGSLMVQATGTIALNSTLQPIGALVGTVAGYGETIDALVAARLVKPRVALMGKLALSALSGTPVDGGRPEIKVPITLQENWLYVGPSKLLKLPTIHWE
ncbi:DUF2125 domain-containing protein [Alphaproteobacteria bacterium]|nr:DUF2125 domain-containing protein [Alphaproteobacteria bacterium]